LSAASAYLPRYDVALLRVGRANKLTKLSQMLIDTVFPTLRKRRGGVVFNSMCSFDPFCFLTAMVKVKDFA
jgi:hypothetical protein